jgi:type I restriction enzyme S subunit
MNWPDVIFDKLYAVPSRNGVYKPKEFHGTGCRVVNMGELFAFDFISNQDMNRLELNDGELAMNSLEDGDLLFGRRSLVEAGAGKCSLVVEPPESLTFESSIIRVRVNKQTANPRFLYYYFRSPQGRGRIRSIVSGVTVKGIRGSDLKRLQVACPPKTVQQTIAAILSAYDDLIENNRRRIALLEQTARLLYEEWFVRLKFPGHERTRIVNGVPAGWPVKKMSEVCETIGGGTPSTKVPEYWDGDITWVVPTDVTRNGDLVLLDSERKITEVGLKESSATMLPAETILMTSRASVGFFALMDRPVCTNQGFINIIPHSDPLRMYLLHNLMHRVEEIRANAKGSTYPEISKGRFREMPITVPPSALLDSFSGFASDAVEQTRYLKKQMAKAREARDLLLPRLMSGEIAA